ncbi:TetR/AcrR family transcriptional regulator [Acinetobacter larvae]|uniref:TetR family transcriptional regulator n=1 Tax=Acinetobacter larvae TaxID=1789224 RepID=A0A1B2M2U1_9GAMM|nr:TetR/AcrR family transcriptional regulator [Acinetobacter larvae]AOA59510.1 TetR family transcriptional regulator [Acinetobacter larvae]
MQNSLTDNPDVPITAPKKRGRPKCFDEQQALERAMLLFWQYGYEATAISDLTQALQITAPSLYSSFGDKAQLFKRCLDYYLEHEACPTDLIFKEAKTAKAALELLMYENAKRLVQENKPTGCMLVVATMNCSEHNQPIQHDIVSRRQQSKLKIFKRLLQGQQQGDLPDTVDIQAMTDYYTTILQGLSLQARDGASLAQLNGVVDHAMQTWHSFIGVKA